MKTWDYVVKGGTIQNYKSFLYRTLHNLVIDEYRKKQSRSLDEILENEFAAPAMELRLSEGGLHDTEEALDEKILLREVRIRISELPTQYRDILTMRFVDGLSTGEIAETVGVTENVVSVRVHRGVAKLKALCNL